MDDEDDEERSAARHAALAEELDWLDHAKRVGWSDDESAVRRRAEVIKRDLAPIGDAASSGFVDPAAINSMRTELASLQAAIAQYESARAVARNTAATDAATDAQTRELRESRTWYTRRFHTSLAIVNAAAFAGVGTHILSRDAEGKLAVVTAACFAAGTIAAGAIPLLKSDDWVSEIQRGSMLHPGFLAGASAALFTGGLLFTLAGLGTIALGHKQDLAAAPRGAPPTTPPATGAPRGPPPATQLRRP